MSRVSGVIIGLLLFGLLMHAAYSDARPILIVGDSLSAGYGMAREASWPSLLADRVEREGYRHSVVNASISGETTAGGVRRIGGLLETHKPAIVVVALGANDGLRGIDINVTRQNLSRIITAIETAGATPILPKVRIPPNYGPLYTGAFESVFDETRRGRSYDCCSLPP